MCLQGMAASWAVSLWCRVSLHYLTVYSMDYSVAFIIYSRRSRLLTSVVLSSRFVVIWMQTDHRGRPVDSSSGPRFWKDTLKCQGVSACLSVCVCLSETQRGFGFKCHSPPLCPLLSLTLSLSLFFPPSPLILISRAISLPLSLLFPSLSL